jgi:hypothetical protein
MNFSVDHTRHHPRGEMVYILGLHARNNGRSCKRHYCCGRETLKLDSVVRLRAVQVWVRGREETAIAAHWVTDGVDRCRVSFLGREFVQDAEKYEGHLVQVVDFLYNSNDPDDVAFSDGNASVCKGVLIHCSSKLTVYSRCVA